MATSLYDFSIPALTRGLTNLSAILEKAATYATAKKIDAAVLARSARQPSARMKPGRHRLGPLSPGAHAGGDQ